MRALERVRLRLGIPKPGAGWKARFWLAGKNTLVTHASQASAERVAQLCREDGLVAQVASVETVGGQVTNLKVSLDTYVGVFTTIGEVSIGIGIILLLLSFPLKYLMHGVK